ncbi:DNA-binding winged helix-turn-helix (wHTH) protein [Bradyrhizobium sp. LM6.11]
MALLVRRAGAPVSKEDLIEAAWPAQAIEDSNLTVQIAAVRRILADISGEARWIETLPRHGYRYVGPSRCDVPAGSRIRRIRSAIADVA